MKKGYLYILFFSIFIAISQAIKYRAYIRKDFSKETLLPFCLQIAFVFFVIYIPGLFLVRWYYKMKDK